jgi:hypothetical protein
MTSELSSLAEAESLAVGVDVKQGATPVQVVRGEDEILALFLQRHEAYLHERELEIQRLRQEIREIRQSRREIELLILRDVLGRSD